MARVYLIYKFALTGWTLNDKTETHYAVPPHNNITCRYKNTTYTAHKHLLPILVKNCDHIQEQWDRMLKKGHWTLI